MSEMAWLNATYKGRINHTRLYGVYDDTYINYLSLRACQNPFYYEIAYEAPGYSIVKGTHPNYCQKIGWIGGTPPPELDGALTFSSMQEVLDNEDNITVYCNGITETSKLTSDHNKYVRFLNYDKDNPCVLSGGTETPTYNISANDINIVFEGFRCTTKGDWKSNFVGCKFENIGSESLWVTVKSFCTFDGLNFDEECSLGAEYAYFCDFTNLTFQRKGFITLAGNCLHCKFENITFADGVNDMEPGGGFYGPGSYAIVTKADYCTFKSIHCGNGATDTLYGGGGGGLAMGGCRRQDIYSPWHSEGGSSEFNYCSFEDIHCGDGGNNAGGGGFAGGGSEYSYGGNCILNNCTINGIRFGNGGDHTTHHCGGGAGGFGGGAGGFSYDSSDTSFDPYKHRGGYLHSCPIFDPQSVQYGAGGSHDTEDSDGNPIYGSFNERDGADGGNTTTPDYVEPGHGVPAVGGSDGEWQEC